VTLIADDHPVENSKVADIPAAAVYRFEQDLVDSFIHSLRTDQSPWGNVRVGAEFFYQSGCTDVVAVAAGGRIIAFEAKLSRWRDALHQAYRNTCFAHLSYVLVPLGVAQRALSFLDEFARRGVGLCYLDGSDVIVLHAAEQMEPLQPWLSAKAIAYADPPEENGDGRS
jgi:hypothetical protein